MSHKNCNPAGEMLIIWTVAVEGAKPLLCVQKTKLDQTGIWRQGEWIGRETLENKRPIKGNKMVSEHLHVIFL